MDAIEKVCMKEYFHGKMKAINAHFVFTWTSASKCHFHVKRRIDAGLAIVISYINIYPI